MNERRRAGASYLVQNACQQPPLQATRYKLVVNRARIACSRTNRRLHFWDTLNPAVAGLPFAFIIGMYFTQVKLGLSFPLSIW